MTESNKRTVLARRNLLRFGAALAALPAALTLAGRDSRAQLSEQEMADVRRIEAYINNIGTMRARFQQVDPNLEISTGSIYLRRPGRMRVEYDPPNPILIIADGALISQVDRKLGELSQLPLGQSTAWFLLRDPIDIDDGITVNRVAGRARCGWSCTRRTSRTTAPSS
jgi:outer membrane lipoprotein-sorting protein